MRVLEMCDGAGEPGKQFVFDNGQVMCQQRRRTSAPFSTHMLTVIVGRRSIKFASKLRQRECRPSERTAERKNAAAKRCVLAPSTTMPRCIIKNELSYFSLHQGVHSFIHKSFFFRFSFFSLAFCLLISPLLRSIITRPCFRSCTRRKLRIWAFQASAF